MIRKAIFASGLVIAALAIVLDGTATDVQACGGCRTRCCRTSCCNTCYYAPAPCCTTCYAPAYYAPACCANVYSVPVYASYASRPYYAAPSYSTPIIAGSPRSMAVTVSYIGSRTSVRKVLVR
jgi:hypothetical protein